MQKLIIDRFEGIYAICENENKNMINIKKSELPKEAQEGTSILLLDSGEIKIDDEETNNRKKRIINLQKKLFK